MTKKQQRSRGRSPAEAAVVGFLARTLFSRVIAGPERTRRDRLASLIPRVGSVALLGDSITEGGEWGELLPGLPMVNRGISGETSSQVLDRLSTAIAQPVAIALLIGTNLWPALADGDAMRREFSFDRVHLNGAGYRAWVSALRPALELVSRDQAARSVSNNMSRPVH